MCLASPGEKRSRLNFAAHPGTHQALCQSTAFTTSLRHSPLIYCELVLFCFLVLGTEPEPCASCLRSTFSTSRLLSRLLRNIVLSILLLGKECFPRKIGKSHMDEIQAWVQRGRLAVQLGMTVHTCNSHTLEAQAREFQVLAQSG